MTDGPDETELARAASVDDALRQLAAEPVRPSRPLVDGALRALRAERGLLTTHVGADGVDRISEAALASVATQAARAVDGVHHASARLAAGEEGRIDVAVEIVAVLGRPLPALADAVRAAVARACARATGLEIGTVDVHVDDVV